jgi:hypothetical protein
MIPSYPSSIVWIVASMIISSLVRGNNVNAIAVKILALAFLLLTERGERSGDAE